MKLALDAVPSALTENTEFDQKPSRARAQLAGSSKINEEEPSQKVLQPQDSYTVTEWA